MSRRTLTRKDRLIQAAIGVPFALGIGLLVGWLVWAQVFPQSYVKAFDVAGTLAAVEQTADGRLVLLEDVKRRTRRSASFSVVRFRVIEANTGNLVGGPWISGKARWLGVSGDLAISVGEEAGLEGRSIKTGDVVLTMADLERLSPEIAGHLDLASANFTLRSDGLLGLTTNQARQLLVDPATKTLTFRTEPLEPSSVPDAARPEWKGLGGYQRMTLTGTEPTFLLARWLEDTNSRRVIGSRGGWLAEHYDKLASGDHGEGLLVSSVDAKGVEAWRHSAGAHGLKAVLEREGSVVLALTNDKGWLVQAVDLATGKERWAVRSGP
jgi:hypothetical protein